MTRRLLPPLHPVVRSAARIALAALVLAPSASAPAHAQGKAERGAFVVRLGNDTIAIERFTRTATRLEGDIVARTPRSSLVHYTAALGPTGSVTRFQLASRPLAGRGAGLTGELTFGRDTVVSRLKAGDSTATQRVAAARPSVPMVGVFSFALYEQAIRAARGAKRPGGSKGDSGLVNIVFVGNPQPVPTNVRQAGQDTVIVDFFNDPAYTRIDGRGRLLAWDGSRTTDKIQVERVGSLDFDALTARFAAADSSGRSLGQLSPRDTAQATIGSAHVVVDYGRPSKRGRTVFGVVVPYDQVWRTGANAATQFSTDRDVTLGTTPLKAGTYTLWTLPSDRGVTLIVNGQTGQWGTDYDAKRDVARIPIESRQLDAPVERFTIAVAPTGEGAGTLRMQWDTTEWSVPIQVR